MNTKNKKDERSVSPILKEVLENDRHRDFVFEAKKDNEFELFFRVYNEKSPQENKYEAGVYMFDERKMLFDHVFENQKSSYTYDVKENDKKDKNTSKANSAVKYSVDQNDIRSKHTFTIYFQQILSSVKYLVFYIKSLRGHPTFSKGSPELRIDFIKQKYDPLFKDQKDCKGEHTAMILGIFIRTEKNDKKQESTWRFCSLDTKTTWIYLTESLQKIYTDLEIIIARLEQEKGKEYIKKNLNDYLNPKKVYNEFKVRRGHELNFPPKQKNFYIKFISQILGDDFDIDLSVLLYDERGFLLNYCYGEKEEPFEKSFINTIGSLELPNESCCSINLSSIEKDQNLSHTKYIVFCLSIYQSKTYNFLWVANNSIEFYEDKKDDPLFKMDLEKSYQTANITSMLYKDEDGIWNFRAIEKHELASDFVDLIDVIRIENFVPRKPIVGVQEMSISGTLDRLDIPRDELLYIKFRHNNYKREDLYNLYLVVYDNRGFVIKFVEVGLSNKDQYGASDPWIEYNLYDLVGKKDDNWTIVGVLTGKFPRGTDLSLVFYDSKKTKIHFQMNLRTELYFETDQPNEDNYYTCFPFQLIQKPKEGGVYLWTVKCEGICTSQNTPNEWYTVIKSHILRDLMGRRNLFHTVTKVEEKSLDEYQSIVVGVQCKKKVFIFISGNDQAAREQTQLVSDIGPKSYRYNDMEKEREMIKLLRTEVYNWYESKKDNVDLIVKGEGDQAQVVFHKLDNNHSLRMISFGIYFPTQERDDVVIKIYSCTSDIEYEILYQQELKLNLTEKSSNLEKEIVASLEKSKDDNVFVPFMFMRNNMDPETGEVKGEDRDWKCSFVFAKYKDIKTQNVVNGIKIPTIGTNFVIESIKCKGLQISESYIKGFIESPVVVKPNDFITQVVVKTKDPEFKEVYVMGTPFDWSNKSILKLQIYEPIKTEGQKTEKTEKTEKIYGEISIPCMHLIPQQFGKYRLFPIYDKSKQLIGEIGLNFRFQKRLEEKNQ